MKVRWIAPDAAGPGLVIERGQVLDLPDEEARRLIDQGKAEPSSGTVETAAKTSRGQRRSYSQRAKR